jgi:uncharacterized membrane protein YgcG
MTKPGLRFALWAGAALAATTIATVAIGASVGANRDVLSQDDVASQLASDGSTPDDGMVVGPSNTATASPGGAVAGNDKILASRAANLVVQCTGNTAVLKSWTPKAGYRVDEVVRGPAAKVSVWLESDPFDDVEAVVTCTDGVAKLTDLVEPDDHGGGGGSGGSGGSGSGGSGSGLSGGGRDSVVPSP